MIQIISFTKMTLAIVLSLFLSSCDFSVNKLNEKKEKLEAEKIVEIFYNNMRPESLQENVSLFDDAFLDIVNFQDFVVSQQEYLEILGQYDSKVLKSWTTERSTLDNKTRVTLVYLVSYKNSKAIEKIDLLKGENDFRIINFVINSKALENKKL